MKSGFGSFGENLGGVFPKVAMELLREGRAIRFRAVGWSMNPAIEDGETISVHPISPEDLKVGDVALFHIEDRLIAHRVLRCPSPENPKFLLRGDAMEESESVTGDQILGIVPDRSQPPRQAAAKRLVHRLKRRLFPQKP
jgi:hypothetical protein